MPEGENAVGSHSILPPWPSGGPRGDCVVVQATKCQYVLVEIHHEHTKPRNLLLFCNKQIPNVKTPAIRMPRRAATVSETLPII